MNLPKISIITIVYNGEQFIEKTIKSVLEQSYRDIEYILIDGNSTDGTIKITNKYKEQISMLISEPDNGIYDAMNKGLKLATGDYVWFINAGDEIYSKDTISNLFSNYGSEADAYYGDVMYVNEEDEELGRRTLKTPPENLTWKSFINGMVVSHQSLIIKRNKTVDYNLKYKHVADLDWCIRSLKNCETIENSNIILSKFLIGGYSKRNILVSNIERLKILFDFYNPVKVIGIQFVLMIKFLKYYFTTRKKYY